ncbi:MAG: rhombosortase [Gammaproteobacteria bacterium]|nr:rhombosortase [Gammaproteobacteria bacterium]
MARNARDLFFQWLRPHYALLSVMLVCCVIQWVGDIAIVYLRFDRAAITDGEVWRLLSANFVHGTWTHLTMNLAALGMVSVLFSRQISAFRWLTSLGVASVWIGVGIWHNQADVEYYVGFSGVLHGLFIIGGLVHSRRQPFEGLGFVAIIAAKLVWEQLAGALPGSEEWAGGPVLVDAHLYGALAGLPMGLYWRWRDGLKPGITPKGS